ncbi:MAG: helix-turn-helix domain-containing protein [Chloroflexota bacterium]
MAATLAPRPALHRLEAQAERRESDAPVPRGRPLPRLRETRLTVPLTQEELAAASGVSVSTIVRLERGDMPAEPATIRKLAAALGVSPRELMAPPARPPSA